MLLKDFSTMRKLVGLCLAAFMALFVSCKKNEISHYFVEILHPTGFGAMIYADQTEDRLSFVTTYDWNLSISDDWLRVNPDSMAGLVPEGYYMSCNLRVNMDVNNTGKPRTGYIYFNAEGKTLATMYSQAHFLHVKRPMRLDDEFVLQNRYDQASDSIFFKTYSDDWTFSFKGEQPEWIELTTDAPTSGVAGDYKVKYLLKPNKTAEPRTAVFQLQSAGIVTDIKVIQFDQPEKE